jgi:hypothetical protein
MLGPAASFRGSSHVDLLTLQGDGLGMLMLAAPLPLAAVLGFLFRRGKNPLAFALGMASATGFLGGGLGMLGFAVQLPIGWVCTFWIFITLWDFSAWLFWTFFISSMMLGLSAHVAFAKIRFEANGTQRIAFRRGMFTAALVLILSSVVALFWFVAAIRM